MRWSVPKWSDFGNIVATIREMDVSAVSQEAEQSVLIACVGHGNALREVSRLLHMGVQRYPLIGASPVIGIPVGEASAQADTIRSAQLVILAIDAQQALTQAENESFARLDQLAIPYLVVLVAGSSLNSDLQLPPAALTRLVVIPEPLALTAQDFLAAAVLDRMPHEFQLAAARRLPGLRGIYSRNLISSTAFTNATYALASGLPEQIPIISIPFVAADMLILTKNQALLVFRIALAHGAEPDFQARIREVIPVIGGAFLWRQAARSLIGLVPVWGLVPKIAIAYAGTYATGVAAWRWFEQGHMVTGEQLKRLSNEALTLGRAKAAELVEQARTAGGRIKDQARVIGTQASQRMQGAGTLVDQVRRKLPFRRK